MKDCADCAVSVVVVATIAVGWVSTGLVGGVIFTSTVDPTGTGISCRCVVTVAVAGAWTSPLAFTINDGVLVTDDCAFPTQRDREEQPVSKKAPITKTDVSFIRLSERVRTRQR